MDLKKVLCKDRFVNAVRYPIDDGSEPRIPQEGRLRDNIEPF